MATVPKPRSGSSWVAQFITREPIPVGAPLDQCQPTRNTRSNAIFFQPWGIRPCRAHLPSCRTLFAFLPAMSGSKQNFPILMIKLPLVFLDLQGQIIPKSGLFSLLAKLIFSGVIEPGKYLHTPKSYPKKGHYARKPTVAASVRRGSQFLSFVVTLHKRTPARTIGRSSVYSKVKGYSLLIIIDFRKDRNYVYSTMNNFIQRLGHQLNLGVLG